MLLLLTVLLPLTVWEGEGEVVTSPDAERLLLLLSVAEGLAAAEEGAERELEGDAEGEPPREPGARALPELEGLEPREEAGVSVLEGLGVPLRLAPTEGVLPGVLLGEAEPEGSGEALPVTVAEPEGSGEALPVTVAEELGEEEEAAAEAALLGLPEALPPRDCVLEGISALLGVVQLLALLL